MRIVLDTEKGRIILPKSFFPQLDKMNKILAEGGSDKKWTAEEYVRDQFEKAMKETMLRAEDSLLHLPQVSLDIKIEGRACVDVA